MPLVAWGSSWRDGSWASGAWASASLVTVPNVTGLSEAAAISAITGAGLVAAKAEDYSTTVAAGDVISQSPLAGASAVSGSTVTYTVSLGERATNTGAGSSRSRRRYVVSIDGQDFEVRSQAEARALLEQARTIAEQTAEKAAQQAERRVNRRVTRGKAIGPAPLNVPPPQISFPQDMQTELEPLRREIQQMYARAAQIAELRMRMRVEQMRRDEEDALLLLM